MSQSTSESYFDARKFQIAVIGLGYVGLPLAVEFAKKYVVVGYDINPVRIAAVKSAYDHTKEIAKEELEAVLFGKGDNKGLTVSGDLDDLRKANIYVITVPTPVDQHKRPDLQPLLLATRTVGSVISEGDIVIYESTVYPGVTEDICVPVLKECSGLIYNRQFFVGYSSERINPGDHEHRLPDIKKVTSGSTPLVAKKIDSLYGSIITAGTYAAPSIKVAEAAKVIENAQRDINIAFVNELAKIFRLMEIDTSDVLAAAATKWNFLPFKPGLVGGHCIGVDPYYLTQKAQELGYNPNIILAGRQVNDGMGEYVVDQIIKQMVKKDITVNNARALILGFTFKENCPDVRNTRVIDIYKELSSYHMSITVYDPIASAAEVRKEYQIELASTVPLAQKFDVIIVAVAHEDFLQFDVQAFSCDNCVLFDVKSILPRETGAIRL